MRKTTGNVEPYRTEMEEEIRSRLIECFNNCPIPEGEILSNLGLFLDSKTLSRVLYMNQLYTQIIDVQGIIIEFGTRWGQNMSLFTALRGIYEPFNRHRKIVGFDTFSGFPSMSDKDSANHPVIKKGAFSVSENYVQYLHTLLSLQEAYNPVAHIKKFDLRPGDATVEIDKYLREYPETIIALVYFDFDIYEPTKACLKAILPHLIKGAVLAFDELNDHDCPGETLALKEILGLNNLKIKRYPPTSRVSYFVME